MHIWIVKKERIWYLEQQNDYYYKYCKRSEKKLNTKKSQSEITLHWIKRMIIYKFSVSPLSTFNTRKCLIMMIARNLSGLCLVLLYRQRGWHPYITVYIGSGFFFLKHLIWKFSFLKNRLSILISIMIKIVSVAKLDSDRH